MVYDTLCLSAGGIFGISYLGALDYLIEEKILNLNDIKNYVGTSVGTIFLFLIILGYSIENINSIIINFNLIKLQSEINIENILENFGINNGNKFICMIKYFLKKKLNIDDITFNELYVKYNKNFIVIGTNYSNGSEAVFNYINTPNMSIITAIRISISIPIIFTPVLYNDNYYVDGGLTNMFPINHCNQETTIAINLSFPDSYKINNILDIFLNSLKIIGKSISCKNKCKIHDNIINIQSHLNNSISLDATLEEKINLINHGRHHTMKHVKNSKLYIKTICLNILDEIIIKIEKL
jgi:predicted acylesterase/phospholipase RssA